MESRGHGVEAIDGQAFRINTVAHAMLLQGIDSSLVTPVHVAIRVCRRIRSSIEGFLTNHIWRRELQRCDFGGHFGIQR